MKSTKNHIFTVSELTLRIKNLLEENFPLIWVTGEINNFSIPSSGHFYFTLKDEKSQISSVMFKQQARNIKFIPENGMAVTGVGRISLYEPRGSYQLIFEYLEPKGIGALHVAFEQLKEKLSKEGLFDQKFKKPIPYLPRKITVITSPTGAVIHDIIKIIGRRYKNVHIEIIPVKVQGNEAEKEIVCAIKLLNKIGDSDVAILARGGGSFEDLSPFNSESVAREIFSSKVPIISAIGHEVDFTIADFVSDLRAPTPSAAAELVVPVKDELKKRTTDLSFYLKNSFYKNIDRLKIRIDELSKRLVNPKKRLEDFKLKLDDLTIRLNKSIYRIIKELTTRLYALNPMAILERGYSITKTIPEDMILKDSKDVALGSKISVSLLKGSLICTVEEKRNFIEL
ncbi:MAG: exodeoxyribonuclease VII large subunit [Desulfobacterales bacterium]|nr:exodeoxyribonuclease VII large subunit [Desulfobacterales bacterium]MBF0398304.1 exodeoxyribonuclease VII large subunit [Desulfobacterales bacterium]